MLRSARFKIEPGIHHVMQKVIDKRKIFLSPMRSLLKV